jgi:hypothetical protein
LAHSRKLFAFAYRFQSSPLDMSFSYELNHKPPATLLVYPRLLQSSTSWICLAGIQDVCKWPTHIIPAATPIWQWHHIVLSLGTGPHIAGISSQPFRAQIFRSISKWAQSVQHKAWNIASRSLWYVHTYCLETNTLRRNTFVWLPASTISVTEGKVVQTVACK